MGVGAGGELGHVVAWSVGLVMLLVVFVEMSVVVRWWWLDCVSVSKQVKIYVRLW